MESKRVGLGTCRLDRGVARIATLFAVSSGLAAFASAQVPDDEGGSWEGPYFWKDQLGLDLQHCDLHEKELSHAALLPKGRHVGKVLIWRQQEGYDAQNDECDDVNTTRVFLVDADSMPEYVIRIDQNLDGSLFCAGTTWQTNGNLLVVGGLPVSGNIFPWEARRFRPGALHPNIQGDATTGFFIDSDPWEQIDNMSTPRYYPTVLTLNDTELDMPVTTGSVAGGASLVIGGPAVVNTQGNEYWELNTPLNTTWSAPLAPSTQTNQLPCHPNCVFEIFDLKGTPTPDQLLDSYPRAWQLTNDQIFIAGDVNTVAGSTGGQGSPSANTPGAAWVIEHPGVIPSDPVNPRWELWSTLSSEDRFYGTAAFFHFQDLKNRALVFGGAAELTPGNWVVHDSVQEFDLTATSPLNARDQFTAQWRNKRDMLKKRLYPNAVILPTGEVLIVGGSASNYVQTQNDDPLMPVFEPELYDIGGAPDLLGDSHLMNRSNLAPIDPNCPNCPMGRIPRLYHSTAILLTDGRVMVIGGENDYDSQTPANSYPEPLFSAEIFSPPYLHYDEFEDMQGNLQKPVIDDSPPSTNFNPTGGTNLTFNVDVTLTDGLNSIGSAALLRPAAVTHHFDYDQRFIELKILNVIYTPGQPKFIRLVIETPQEDLGPAGYYMLFVLETATTGRSVPSNAAFIRFNPAS